MPHLVLIPCGEVKAERRAGFVPVRFGRRVVDWPVAMMNREQRRVLDQLLWRRAHGDPSSELLVEWATAALAAGLDSPHLRILAGLPALCNWSEVEQYFSQTLADFRLSEAGPGEVLIKEIREAFPTEPLPARPVTGHRCHECDTVDRQFGGQPWPAVAACMPDYCHGAFPLLTADSRIYYLPAYLEYALREPDGMASYSVEGVLKRGDFQREGFTPAQRDVLAAWIEYRAGDPVPDDMGELVDYWRGP